jgi:D-3-phosphoglycerate dehydrogenase
MKVLANDGISQSGIKALEAAGFTVDTNHIPQDQLIQGFNDGGYCGILVRSATTVRKDMMDACPNMKFVGRGGVGMDNIDVAYGRENGIDVFNTPSASSQSVGELVMGHLFAGARGLHDANRRMAGSDADGFKSLKKKFGKGMELRGKKLGIIGFGRIGRSTASYALGCGMDVVASDFFPNDEPIKLNVAGQTLEVKVPHIDMSELIKTCDCISIHVPKQKDGSAVIGENELSAMKDGVILINAARGGVIDEDALLAALSSEKVRYAALDVYENEPTPRQDLLNHDGIGVSPHIGAATLEAQDRIGTELAENIIRVMDAIA